MMDFYRRLTKQLQEQNLLLVPVYVLIIMMLMLLLAVSAFSQFDSPEKKWKVGPWDMGVFFYEDSKNFSHCSMGTTYFGATDDHVKTMKTKAMSLIIKVNYDTSFNFTLLGYDWKLINGKKYNVYSKYDTGKDYNINTIAEDDIALGVNFGADSAWLQNFMKAKTVEFSIDGTFIGSFLLKGTNDASKALLNCFGKHSKDLSEPTFGEGKE